MHVENVHEPIVNLNIKMVDNRLSMVYNTNIRNFYLKMKETSIRKSLVILDSCNELTDSDTGASSASST